MNYHSIVDVHWTYLMMILIYKNFRKLSSFIFFEFVDLNKKTKNHLDLNIMNMRVNYMYLITMIGKCLNFKLHKLYVIKC